MQGRHGGDQAFVHRLLREKPPDFAVALELAVRGLSCQLEARC
jgi:hypothetical protein